MKRIIYLIVLAVGIPVFAVGGFDCILAAWREPRLGWRLVLLIIAALIANFVYGRCKVFLYWLKPPGKFSD